MKRILILFLLWNTAAEAQPGYGKPNNSYGVIFNRVRADSVQHIPTINDTLSHTIDTSSQIRVINGQLWYKSTYWRQVGGAGTATWGSIIGTLSSQTDLQAALNAKQNTITTGTTAQYIRGDLSLGTFSTAVRAVGDPVYAPIVHSQTFATISDGTVAVRALFSGGVGISYNAATGVITATGGGGSSTWGGITGTISSQSDLITLLSDSTLQVRNDFAARLINTGYGLTGGGDFSMDRTHVVDSTVIASKTYALAAAALRQAQLNGTGFVKATGTTISYDNSTYLTGNQTITLSGDITGSGATAITTTLPTINSNVGTFNSVTVNGKGQVTAATNVSHVDSIPLRNTVYVSKNGNDATGLRNRLDKPFLTIQAAIDAALSGDEVIIYPGTYENTNPISLSKGVNFTFIGKGEMQLNTASTTGALFTDSTTVSTSIINAPGWIFTARSSQYFLRLTAASNIKMIIDEATGSSGSHCIDIRNSSLLNIKANRVHSANSVIWTQDAASFIGNIENIEVDAATGFGVWISNTAIFNLHSKRILDKEPTNANYLVYVAGSIATDSIYIEANEIKAALEWAVWGRGASKNVHVKAQTISAKSDCVVVSGITSPGWMTVQADVIENTTTGAMDGIVHGEGGNLIVIDATLVRNALATGNDIKTSNMGGIDGAVKLVGVSYDITKVSEVIAGSVTRSDNDFYSGMTGNFTSGSSNDSLLVWNATNKSVKAVNGNSFKGGSYTYTVAASDAPAIIKARADYVCDGTADESEIQTALALGNVQLTQGTYRISTTGIQMPSNKRMNGVGKATILLAVGYSTTEKMITASGTTGISIGNLKIDGAGRTLGYGIFFQLVGSGSGSTATAGALIENIYIDSTWTAGIQFESCQNSYIQNVTSTGAGLYGVNLKKKTGEAKGCVNVTIDKLNSFSPGASGIWVNQSEYCKITNCVLEGKTTIASQNGIRLWSSTHCIISNSTIYNSGEANVYLSVGSYNSVIGNKIYGSVEDGINCEADDYCLISGNQLNYSGTYGVDMEGNHCTVVDNSFIGNSQQTNATYSGIEIGSLYCTIVGNKFWKGTLSNKPSYGIRFIVGSGNSMVEGNDCYEAGVTGDIQNDGGTNLRIRNNRGLTGTWKDLLVTDYEVEMGTGKMLGRTTASQGKIEEITVAAPLLLSSGTLRPDTSTGSTHLASQFFVSNAIAGITPYTDEQAQDAAASLIQNGTGITWSYNDGSNTLTPTVTITQYTDALARAAISLTTTGTSGAATYNSSTGVFNIPTPGIVTASNGLNKTGNDIALGGTTLAGADADLSRDTYLDANGNVFFINQNSNTNTALSLQNGGTAYTLNVTSTGGGGLFVSAPATAISTQSTNGSAIVAFTTGTGTPGSFLKITSSTNTVKQIINLTTTLSSGTAADGIGSSIGFSADASTGSTPLMGTLSYKWTNATYASRESQAFINGVNNTVDEVFANFQTGGIVIVNNGADTLATKTYARGSGGGGGGSGTVTNTGGNLTSNALVLGAGTVDTKVAAGIITDGVSQITLGVNTTTLGKLKMFGSTSGDVTIQPNVVAGTATVLTLPASTGTLALTSQITGTNSGTNTGDQTTTGTSNRITVTNGTTNPVIDISSAYVGQATITTLGTIVTGVWNGTAITDTYISSASTWNAKQDGIQYKDEGVNLGTAGTATSVDFVGANVTTTRSTNAVTVTMATQTTVSGNAGTATTLQTSRNLWGQAFTGAADVTGSLTSVGDITGGASNMIITSGTGASRTLVFKTTTAGSTATTALTLAADQSATFANTVNATTFVGALTGTASKATNLVGGNGTTLLGSVPYQSGTDATTLLSPNTTTTKKFFTQTGDGTNGAAPGWNTIVAGDVPTLNQSTTGSAATITTTRTLWGQNFNGSANVTGDITLSTANITMTGSIGATGARVTKGWFTDGEFTNMPTVGGTSLSSTFSAIAGSASIVTVGTITSGTWNGTAITVANGGTGRSTSTTAYGLIAAGTTATGAHQTLAAGATTEILVGGGSSALPVWTTATGTGAPVRATSPTLVTPNLGTPSTLVLTNATGLPSLNKSYSAAAPTSSETIDMWYTAAAITITEVREVLRGSSPSVTYTINYGSSPTSATNTIVASHAATSTSGAAATLNVTSIPAGSYIWLTTSATSGTVNNFNFTVTYTQ